jgi:hypothetical protein
MSFFEGMTNPGAKMSNAFVPKPAGGVIGPPKMKMPEIGGDSQLRAGIGMMRSSLSPKLKPLPSAPTQPVKADNSLLETTSGPSALHGIRRPF